MITTIRLVHTHHLTVQIFFLVMRIFKPLRNFQIYVIIYCCHPAVCYVPRTYLSYSRKLVPFDYLHPIIPSTPHTPASGSHQSDPCFYEFISLSKICSFVSYLDYTYQ